MLDEAVDEPLSRDDRTLDDELTKILVDTGDRETIQNTTAL
jgi:hypothetical protein